MTPTDAAEEFIDPDSAAGAAGAPADETAEAPVEEDGFQRVNVVLKSLPTYRRLDQYLPSRFPRFSRSAIQKLIESGAVTVNGQPTKASRKLSAGDVIDVVLPPPQPKEIPPENIPLDIIWEDDCLLAINKQAGIIVHPARGNPHGTLVNGLMFYAGKLAQGSDPFRPGIIHRLDRDTTGIMLVAKTDEALWRMSRQFEARRIHKEYLAVVHGRLDLDADQIDAPLARHRFVREKYAVDLDNPQAKAAVTTWRVVERFGPGFTLVQLEPKTGRTHQLRVHMSYIKHPIVGDVAYGGSRVTRNDLANMANRATARSACVKRIRRTVKASQAATSSAPPPEPVLIHRQALHAHRLNFRHPITNAPMALVAPPPADFLALLAALRELRGEKPGN